jgi:hypothetical protein
MTHDSPPESVGRALVGKRVDGVEGLVDQWADVDVSRLQCPESLREAAEFGVRPDFLWHEFEKFVAGAVDAQHRAHPALELLLVGRNRRPRLHGAGDTGVVLGDVERCAPDREVAAQCRVLGCGES